MVFILFKSIKAQVKAAFRFQGSGRAVAGQNRVLAGKGAKLASQGVYLGDGGERAGGFAHKAGAQGVAGEQQPPDFIDRGIRRVSGDRNHLGLERAYVEYVPVPHKGGSVLAYNGVDCENLGAVYPYNCLEPLHMMRVIVGDEHAAQQVIVVFDKADDLRVHVPRVDDDRLPRRRLLLRFFPAGKIRPKDVTVAEAEGAVMIKEFHRYSSISKIASAVLDDLKEMFSRRVFTKFVHFRLQSTKSELTMSASIKRSLYRFELLKVVSVITVPPKLTFTSSEPSKVQSLMVEPASDTNCKSLEEKSQEVNVAKLKNVMRIKAPVKRHMEKVAPEKSQP